MLSSRFAGIPISSSTIDEPGVPQLPNRGEQTLRAVTGSGGRLHFGMVAGIKSERRPTSNRNPWPDCLGIRTRGGRVRGSCCFAAHVNDPLNRRGRRSTVLSKRTIARCRMMLTVLAAPEASKVDPGLRIQTPLQLDSLQHRLLVTAPR